MAEQDGDTPQTPSPFPALDAEQLAAMETLAMNLGRAAMAAQGALGGAVLGRMGQPPGFDADPLRAGPAMTEIAGQLAGNPEKLVKAQAELLTGYMSLWSSTALRLSGQAADPVVSPAKGDKRFNDADWSDNPVFDAMKQSYLLTSNWLNGLVAEAEVEPAAKRRAQFFMRQLTDALSPSNFLMSNPAALRAMAESKGESLVKGLQNLSADLERGGGKLAISQTDYEQFEVGVNVATAPGKVVFQNELFQLLQFDPSTEQVHETPLLIFPPWINKFYILDLQPANSMIRWLSSQGFTVFLVSWVNPGVELAETTFEDYVRHGAYEAVAQVIAQTGVEQINTVGYCIGGTMLSTALAHMAAEGVQPIASATFFAAQQDFSDPGELSVFIGDDWLEEIERQIDAGGGVLPGSAMAGSFNMLRANDLIWSFFVNNYLMGNEPKPFDLLFWNSDQTRMPKALHLFYLREFYRHNRLAKGELELGGRRLDLGEVTIPIFVQSSESDHIAPYASVYRGAKLFGGPVTFMMAGSGHIAGVINPPGAKKYQHWIADLADLPETVEQWREHAKEFPYSWWPYWAEWLKARSGDMVPARDPAAGPLGVIEDAPGSYVKVKS